MADRKLDHPDSEGSAVNLVNRLEMVSRTEMTEADYKSKTDSMHKIVVCHLVYGGAWAGVEVQVATLLAALKPLPGIELYAIVFSEGRLAQELIGLGIPVKLVSDRSGLLGQLRECHRLLKEKKVDILHSHQHRENFFSFMLSLLPGTPLLVQTQHGHPELFSGFSRIKRRLWLAVERFTAKRRVGRVIAVSSEVAGYLKTYLPAEKIAVVRNGIGTDRVRCGLSPAEAKTRLGLPPHSVVVGTAARLESVKRLDLFLEVAQRLSTVLPEAFFVIAGRGSEEARLRELIKSHHLEKSVRLLGHRDDIYDVLRAIDLLLITSDREGIPMVVLEAMTLGVPVVARAVGGLVELLENGRIGVLAQSQDPQELARCCLTVLSDPVLRTRLAQDGRNAVACHYSATGNAVQTFELYRSLAFSVCDPGSVRSHKKVRFQPEH